MKKKRKKQYMTVHLTPESIQVEAQPAAPGRVRVGDAVIRTPITFEARGSRDIGPMRGKVVYVHPLGRFHVVEFGEEERAVQECLDEEPTKISIHKLVKWYG